MATLISINTVNRVPTKISEKKSRELKQKSREDLSNKFYPLEVVRTQLNEATVHLLILIIFNITGLPLFESKNLA